MYDVFFDGKVYWITYNGIILNELGSFIDPVSPRIIIEEIEDEV